MSTKTKTINAGPVGLKPKGAYNPITTYTLLDCVLYNHDSWVCKAMTADGSPAEITGQAPADGSQYWTALTDGGRAAYAEGQAAAAATTLAENVDVEVDGMVVTITNRNGVSRQVNIGFEIYRTYTSKALMKADAANVPAGKFVMIGTTDATDPDNATLWARNSQAASSQNPFDFLSDLDQAATSAWADWLDNMKPLIEADHQTAQADHTQAVSDSTRAGQDHTTATGDHTQAGTDHTQAVSDSTRASLDHTQAAADSTQAGTDHSTAVSDHSIATADHTQVGTDHTQAVSDHNRAENDHTDAVAATALANEKAALADTKAQYAETQGDYAKAQGDYAKEWNDHPPYIGNDNYWYIWDAANDVYRKSAYAKGDDLHWDEMTEQEKEALAQRVLAELVFATDATCEDIIDELT